MQRRNTGSDVADRTSNAMLIQVAGAAAVKGRSPILMR